MAKEGSVAPRERINIKYVPATGDVQAEVELPLKMLVVGDFKGYPIEQRIEEREAVSIDKNNFTAVMAKSDLSLTMAVPNKLLEDENSDLAVSLKFNSLADFSPDSLVQQVPELKKLMELREALVALKGPLGNIPAFRLHLQQILADEAARERLIKEVNSLDAPSSALTKTSEPLQGQVDEATTDEPKDSSNISS